MRHLFGLQPAANAFDEPAPSRRSNASSPTTGFVVAAPRMTAKAARATPGEPLRGARRWRSRSAPPSASGRASQLSRAGRATDAAAASARPRGCRPPAPGRRSRSRRRGALPAEPHLTRWAPCGARTVARTRPAPAAPGASRCSRRRTPEGTHAPVRRSAARRRPRRPLWRASGCPCCRTARRAGFPRRALGGYVFVRHAARGRPRARCGRRCCARRAGLPRARRDREAGRRRRAGEFFVRNRLTRTAARSTVPSRSGRARARRR